MNIEVVKHQRAKPPSKSLLRREGIALSEDRKEISEKQLQCGGFYRIENKIFTSWRIGIRCFSFPVPVLASGISHQVLWVLRTRKLRRWTVCALPRVHSILDSGRFHSMDCKGESSATRMLLCYGRQFVDTLYHTKSASLISNEFSLSYV